MYFDQIGNNDLLRIVHIKEESFFKSAFNFFFQNLFWKSSKLNKTSKNWYT